MNKNLIILLMGICGTLLISACSKSYDVEGTSNVSTLDGRKIVLKLMGNDGFKNIDSCDVVHGQFSFHGNIDSTSIANISVENEQLMPIVLEEGKIVVKMDDSQMTVSGTPMNDKLNTFMKKFSQITSDREDLIHQQNQAIMDGKDMDVVNAQLQQEDVRLTAQQDSLVTSFITDNFDNVLGPWGFAIVTASYQYPELTPWIEDIMSKATDKFKMNPIVKDYYDKAKENQAIMNGTK